MTKKEMDAAWRAALKEIRTDKALFGPKGALPAYLEPIKSGAPRVLLVTGSNASGKSLVGRFIGLVLRDEVAPKEFQNMNIGMQMRTAGGFARAFVFGDEGDSSTGQLTHKSVSGLIHNSGNREMLHLAILDEPDLGLSEDFAEAMGEKIAAYGKNLGPRCIGLIVTTHSRPLAAELFAIGATCLRMGDPTPTKEWIAGGRKRRTLKELDALPDIGLKNFRAVIKVVDKRKKKQ